MKRKFLFVTIIGVSVVFSGCNRATPNSLQEGQTDTAPQRQASIVDVAEEAAEYYCGYSIANQVSDNEIRNSMREKAEEKLRDIRSAIAIKGYSNRVVSVTTMIGDEATRYVFSQEQSLPTALSKAPDDRARYFVELCSKHIRSTAKYANLINTNL